MTRSDIITQLCSDFDFSKAKASEVLDTVFNKVTEGLNDSSREVKISGFGRFNAVKTAERKGRNPKTGESITIPSRVNVKFRMLGILKGSVNSI